MTFIITSATSLVLGTRFVWILALLPMIWGGHCLFNLILYTAWRTVIFKKWHWKENVLLSHWYLSPDDHTLILGKKYRQKKIHLTQKLQSELLHYQNWRKTYLIICGSHNLLLSMVYQCYLEFIQNGHRIEHNKRWGT